MEDLLLGIGESRLDTERLGDDVVIALVPRRGAAAVVDDLGAVGAAEAGHAAGALGEEERRPATGGVPRRLWRG